MSGQDSTNIFLQDALFYFWISETKNGDDHSTFCFLHPWLPWNVTKFIKLRNQIEWKQNFQKKNVTTHADSGEVQRRHLQNVVVLVVQEELGLPVEELRFVAAALLWPADGPRQNAVEQPICTNKAKQNWYKAELHRLFVPDVLMQTSDWRFHFWGATFRGYDFGCGSDGPSVHIRVTSQGVDPCSVQCARVHPLQLVRYLRLYWSESSFHKCPWPSKSQGYILNISHFAWANKQSNHPHWCHLGQIT